MKAGAGIWAGAEAQASALFSVDTAGAMTAKSGAIGGWTIAAGKISITGLELDSANNRFRAFTGSNYVDITAAGITGHDSVLGTTFKLPTDGSAPEFSSGVIKECVYEIYTSGIIRTDANPAANGGLLINPTNIVGYNSSGVKLLQLVYDGADQGDAYIGNYDNAAAGIKYDHSAATLNIRGSVTITGGSGYANLSDKPTDLSGINSTEGTKLSGIEAGADVTSTHTAANTTNVGTVLASRVAGWAHSSDTTKIDGGDIYTGTITASAIYGAGFGTLTITSGKIVINAASGLEIDGSGDLTVKTGGNVDIANGGDLIMRSVAGSTDADRSIIKFPVANSEEFRIYSDYSNRRLCIAPAADYSSNQTSFIIGYDYAEGAKRFMAILMAAAYSSQLLAINSDGDYSGILLESDVAGVSKLTIECQQTSADSAYIYLSSEDISGYDSSIYCHAKEMTISVDSLKIKDTCLTRLGGKKSSTGDPIAPDETQITINNYDNVIKIYADGAWRTIATW
jgi:hypothetical protein